MFSYTRYQAIDNFVWTGMLLALYIPAISTMYQSAEYTDLSKSMASIVDLEYNATSESLSKMMSSEIMLYSRDENLISNQSDDTYFSFQMQLPFKSMAIAVSVIGALFSLICSILLNRFKKERVFRAASRTFMSILVWGTLLMWIGMFLKGLSSSATVFTCYGIYFTQYIGFSIVFGTLVVKSLRIVQFSKSSENRLPRLNDYVLLRSLWGYIAAWAVLIVAAIMWQNSIRPIGLNIKVDSNSQLEYATCQAKSAEIIWDGFQALSIALGVFVSLQCRGMPSAYNEGTYISLTIYNWALTWTIGKLIRKLWKPSLDPGLELFLEIIESFGCVSTVLLMLFAPKVMLMLQGDKPKLPHHNGNKNMDDSNPKGPYPQHMLSAQRGAIKTVSTDTISPISESGSTRSLLSSSNADNSSSVSMGLGKKSDIIVVVASQPVQGKQAPISKTKM
ncbi:hypothetical protein BDV3_007155 [Batrachochytrium dendrobatidis]|uniref:G-protein coupled receptors family 3 profile domain-containing protein n=1 Tax=Batrachochytrium dendrobatidis (strain JEL423) TaxID=403673 RepID=A0A177WQB4_BATDL|nr:hypothetical protein BDEG_25783 [Batrachochytrium dendrobatidis JEL423]